MTQWKLWVDLGHELLPYLPFRCSFKIESAEVCRLISIDFCSIIRANGDNTVNIRLVDG